MNNFMGPQINTRSAVFNLIAINVLFFVVTNWLPGLFGGQSPYMLLGLHYPSSEYFRPWQIITHMFMHGGIAHIFFNMFNLYIFGNMLESVWGPKRFLEFYFITGLGAVALYLGVQAVEVFSICGSFAPSNILVDPGSRLFNIINIPMLGASGAIFGVMMGFATLFPNTEFMMMFPPMPIKAKYLVGGLTLIELYLGLQNNPGDNVAHFAHLGGALIGYIMIKIWNRSKTTFY